ncbi:oxygenase MpaB family protein [Streptomyces sp. BI20]|uniref:oxygenase MpaB family protein n=1 Tax=Streptomyces sp. BI20 TaxID=3403460 RepID=UPI003C73F36B
MNAHTDPTARRPGPAPAPPDPGLYGPGSVTWQCHGDPVMWIAGVRALWLQALHPRAVRGVMANSDFRQDAWGRLLRTADFVGTLTYDTTAEAEAAGARVRRVHRSLTARDPVDDTPYRLDDPDLLLWVHCAQISSFLEVLRRSGVPLTDARADAYVAENRVNARLVGLDPTGAPGTVAALDARLEAFRPVLAAGADARAVEDFLRSPPVPARLLLPARRVLWSPVSTLAYDTLPPWAHALYGRPAPPPAEVDRRLRRLAGVLRAVPAGLRWRLPPGHILRAMRRMGPGSRPSSYRPPRSAAILERLGRAREDHENHDGGDNRRWRSPG